MGAGTTTSGMFSLFALFILAFLFSTAEASVPAATYVAQGNGDNLTISINVPQNNTDNLFFHFSAPAVQSWAAFGIGSQMAGSLMFVVYAAADGKNVTVSPRLGLKHEQPLHTSDVKMSLLEGSGISDDSFVVNGFCSGCRSWNDGSVNVDSTSQNMIWALGPSGTTLQSDDLSATIIQHETFSTFSLNLKNATGIGGVPNVLSGETAVSNDPTDGDGTRNFHAGVAFHALFMAGSFLVLFPAGYLFLRVFEKVWLHMGIQSFATVVVLIGTVAGIVLSIRQDFNPHLTSPHQIIGLIVMILVFSSWTVGFMGHRIYKKTGTPAKPMKIHRILGPVTIGLGLINACLGFNFSGNNRAIIGFVVITILMVIFVSTIVFFKKRRQVRKQALNTPAANNFRQGQMEPQYGGPLPPPDYQQSIPLRSYSDTAGPPVYR